MNKKELIEEYISKHPNLFSFFEKNYLINNCEHDYSNELIPDIIREVFDELGILKDEENMFLGFRDLLDDVFSIKDKNIVEIGGGVIPRLAYRISDIQTTGSIKVYDPRLSEYVQSSDRLILIKKAFNPWIDVSDADILIGLMPCEITEGIILSAVKSNKDFMIGLSDATIYDDYSDYFPSPEEWIEGVIGYADRLLNESGRGKLKIKYLDQYNNPYPVIYNKK